MLNQSKRKKKKTSTENSVSQVCLCPNHRKIFYWFSFNIISSKPRALWRKPTSRNETKRHDRFWISPALLARDGSGSLDDMPRKRRPQSRDDIPKKLHDEYIWIYKNTAYAYTRNSYHRSMRVIWCYTYRTTKEKMGSLSILPNGGKKQYLKGS